MHLFITIECKSVYVDTHYTLGANVFVYVKMQDDKAELCVHVFVILISVGLHYRGLEPFQFC